MSVPFLTLYLFYTYPLYRIQTGVSSFAHFIPVLYIFFLQNTDRCQFFCSRYTCFIHILSTEYRQVSVCFLTLYLFYTYSLYRIQTGVSSFPHFIPVLYITSLQNNDRCQCGDSFGKHGPSSACTHLCTDEIQICGGSLANSVYRTWQGELLILCRKKM